MAENLQPGTIQDQEEVKVQSGRARAALPASDLPAATPVPSAAAGGSAPAGSAGGSGASTAP